MPHNHHGFSQEPSDFYFKDKKDKQHLVHSPCISSSSVLLAQQLHHHHHRDFSHHQDENMLKTQYCHPRCLFVHIKILTRKKRYCFKCLKTVITTILTLSAAKNTNTKEGMKTLWNSCCLTSSDLAYVFFFCLMLANYSPNSSHFELMIIYTVCYSPALLVAPMQNWQLTRNQVNGSFN